MPQEIPSIFSSSPEEMPKLFVQFWNKRDAIKLAGLFAEDAEFINVVGLWWHNRQAIWKAHDYGLTRIFQDSIAELRKTKVRYISEDVAIVYARMQLKGQSAHGDISQPQKRSNIFTLVTQKKELGWICISAHNTDQVQGKETNIIASDGKMSSVDYRSNTPK